jgi:hypothetical protein
MSIDERLRAALTPIEDVVKPNLYDGPETEYIVFNYDEGGRLFAEGRPRAIICRVMVHLYIPSGVNPNGKKQEICEAISAAGGTWPTITNASDKEGQHYVFEFEMMKGNDPVGNA